MAKTLFSRFDTIRVTYVTQRFFTYLAFYATLD